MILPLVAVLFQAVSAEPGERPVQVWLGASGPIAPGERVRVFVQTAVDGYLIVLRSRTDRRIEVLFPAAPTEDAFVPAGGYEVRGPDAGAAFAALEPPGTGLVIAALSPTRFRPDEFMHRAAWNPAALVASWSEADAEGALTDIVQRLLGDGYFSYDIVAYTVATRPVMPQAPVAGTPGVDQCSGGGCAVAGVTVLIVPLVLVCDPFTAVCQDLAFFPREHRLPRPIVDPACAGPFACRPRGEERTIVLAPRPGGGGARAAVVPRRRELSRLVTQRRPTGPAPVVPRPRTTVAQPPGREARVVMGRARQAAPPVMQGTGGLARIAEPAPIPTAEPTRAAAVVSPEPRARTLAALPGMTLPARGATALPAGGTRGGTVTSTPRTEGPRTIALPRATTSSGVRVRRLPTPR